MKDLFFFDPEILGEIAERHRGDFKKALPFPHVVIDDFLPEELLEEVVKEVPSPEERDDWVRHDGPEAVKIGFPRDWLLGSTTRHLLNQFNSGVFINFLESLTEIKGLIPDPHYVGGGLHQILRGGFLKIHADFNRYHRLNLDRRLNALLYLNRNWKEEWGGQLELWNSDITEKVEAIVPLFNRLVIFATTDESFHGHPDPLECPRDQVRRSLALYYYTNGRPEHESSAPHTTLHRPRPGESFVQSSSYSRPARKWAEFVPPVAITWARKAKQQYHTIRSRRSS